MLDVHGLNPACPSTGFPSLRAKPAATYMSLLTGKCMLFPNSISGPADPRVAPSEGAMNHFLPACSASDQVMGETEGHWGRACCSHDTASCAGEERAGQACSTQIP